MGSKPNNNMIFYKDNEQDNQPNNNLIRPRSNPICPYNLYSSQTQFNVAINNILFLAINPPEDYESITKAGNFDQV